jgi:hypothetical protein
LAEVVQGAALPEWLGKSHMSVLRGMLGADLFSEKTYFWNERPNFWAHTNVDKKETCINRRKSIMQEENPHARRKKSLTILGLGFLIRIVMTLIL